MKLKLLKYFGILLLICVFFSQCERKLTGWGEDCEIRVLADSTLWMDTEPILRKIFEKPILTPQEETIFSIIHGDITNFKRYKNLIFLSTLDCDDKIAELVKANLSEEAKQKVKEGNYVFLKKEKWASNQLIMFLVSTNIETLTEKIIANKNYLFNLFDEYWTESQKIQMFRRYEQKDIERQLIEKYGWMVKVQHDYKIFVEEPDSNFVMLRRMLPERWLFVHWIETDEPSVITKRWCIDLRNKIGVNFYNGDQVEEKYVQPDSAIVDFLGRRALKITGLWRNDEKEAGGPFRTYCFYDEHSGRIYMLDFAIFSPRLKKSKRQYLRQAEIILHTFKTDDEISVKDIIN